MLSMNKINCSHIKESCAVLNSGEFWFFLITCVRVLAHLSSELFNTGQFYNSSFGCGCSCERLILVLVLLIPGSFSVSHKRQP